MSSYWWCKNKNWEIIKVSNSNGCLHWDTVVQWLAEAACPVGHNRTHTVGVYICAMNLEKKKLHGHPSSCVCRLEGHRRPGPAAERPEGGVGPAPWPDKRSSPPLCLPRYQQLFDRFLWACLPTRLNGNTRAVEVCVTVRWPLEKPEPWNLTVIVTWCTHWTTCEHMLYLP